MPHNYYIIVEENEVFIGESGDFAKTSPLLECAGLFIYDKNQRRGVLIHWQDKTAKKKTRAALHQSKLQNPYAILRGCGIPTECLSLSESRVYREVKEFLRAERIPVRSEKTGLDCRVQLSVRFSDGVYSTRCQ